MRKRKEKREKENDETNTKPYALVFQASIQISHGPMKMRNMYIPNEIQ